MSNELKFFIDGAWVDPAVPARLDVIDPSTEEAYTQISVGSAADVDRAVAAARAAFDGFAASPKAERIALLERMLAIYRRRADDLTRAMSQEMGAPISFAREWQTFVGDAHLERAIQALRELEETEIVGRLAVVREPIGVCGLITPWNWPMNQIVCKVAPALAVGCTVVLKPSEIAPISGIIFAEIVEEAGAPKGVFNLVNGDGPTVGAAMSAHPDIDMMSFTGSTRAGIAVAKAAADTVKRVTQELGGKSPNIILPDADFATAVADGVAGCFGNTGQSCDAPSRMLVPADRYEEAAEIARAKAATFKVGDPRREDTDLGPLVSRLQFDKVQRLIEAGIAEGAELLAGGPGRPDGLNRGYYVRPTVFGRVTPDMTISREEIFGPVLSILTYDSEDEAVRMANDTVYGLAAYVQSGDIGHARRIAAKLRAGAIRINGPPFDPNAPFGGYKQSGNGRECGKYALDDYLEIKAIEGYESA